MAEGDAARALAAAEYSTRMLSMADGTRLAVDLYLPASGCGTAEKRFNFVCVPCRYGRGWRLRWPLSQLAGLSSKPVSLLYSAHLPAWLAADLAVVLFDVRGTGASFGAWRRPWSDEERRDTLDILTWAAAQPWARLGRCAALAGISYDAVAALGAARAGHPALRCVVAISPPLNLFCDVSFPGGVPLASFRRNWARGAAAFDTGQLYRLPGAGALLAVALQGVAAGGSCAAAEAAVRMAAAQHAACNWEPDAALRVLRCVDDALPASGCQLFTAFIGQQQQHHAFHSPIYWSSGWLDATADSALQGFRASPPGSVLTLGPWSHQLREQVVLSGHGGARRSAFPAATDALAFMLHLFDDAPAASSLPDSAVRIFEMGPAAGRWRLFPSWPTTTSAAQRVFLLAAPGLMHEAAAGTSGTAAAGSRSSSVHETPAGRASLAVCARRSVGVPPLVRSLCRWGALTRSGAVAYSPVTASPFRLLFVAAEPLAAPLRVLGRPVVTLWIDFQQPDVEGGADLFAYLVDVDARGCARYVTEGCLCAAHRPTCSDVDLGVQAWQAAPCAPARSFQRACMAAPASGSTPTQHRFALLPTAYQFSSGTRVGLALSGGDRNHFRDAGTGVCHAELGVAYGGAQPSELALPICE